MQRSLDFLDFISIPKKMIVLISSNRCGMVGVGLRGLRKKENELSNKNRILLAIQITTELVVFLGIRTGASCDSIGCLLC